MVIWDLKDLNNVKPYLSFVKYDIFTKQLLLVTWYIIMYRYKNKPMIQLFDQ